MRERFFIVALALAAGLGLARLTAVPAEAQYPPTSHMTVQVVGSTTNSTPGGTVSIAATVQDSGSPQADVSCSFAIGSQPGNDAKLVATQATTNAQGVATTSLFVGSTAGTVDVTATCNGITQHFGVVLGASTAPGHVALPNSGTGPAGTDRGWLSWAVLGLMLLTGAGALAVARGRRIRQ